MQNTVTELGAASTHDLLMTGKSIVFENMLGLCDAELIPQLSIESQIHLNGFVTNLPYVFSNATRLCLDLVEAGQKVSSWVDFQVPSDKACADKTTIQNIMMFVNATMFQASKEMTTYLSGEYSGFPCAA